MTESAERKTLNTEILKRLDEHSIMLTDLSLTMKLFIQEQKGDHCNINKELDEVRMEVFGNGGKQRLREMVTRLWEDKITAKTIYLAVTICILTSLLSMIIK